jgi:2-succinyl-6-hydroxy-2,4-cyclohexadiene-1-carboxylate synthase
VTAARYRLIAIHGFLGSPADWLPLQALLPEASWECVDAWELFSGPRVHDWPSLGSALGARLVSALNDDGLLSFVVAYSFGARLALAVPALGRAGSPFAGTCLVSCHPGLPDADEGVRAARRESDARWAERFVDAPVGRIWKEWDAQPAFVGTSAPTRSDRLPAPRVALARAMRVASLGAQPDRRDVLRNWQQPLLWVTGERDVKFRAIARELEELAVPGTFATCDRAGHRVPWDNPSAFARILGGWVDGVLG